MSSPAEIFDSANTLNKKRNFAECGLEDEHCPVKRTIVALDETDFQEIIDANTNLEKSVEEKNDVVTTSKDVNNDSFLKELKNKFGANECKLCDAKLQTNQNINHYTGKVHKRKLTAYLRGNNRVDLFACFNIDTSGTPKTKSSTVFCDICNIELSSELSAKDHFVGARHRKNMLKNQGKDFIRVKEAKVDLTGRFGIGEAFTENTSCDLTEGEIKNRCTICDVDCQPANYIDHVNGVKHSKALKRLEVEQSNNYASYRLPSGSYFCPVCNITCNTIESFIVHVNSKKHKKHNSK